MILSINESMMKLKKYPNNNKDIIKAVLMEQEMGVNKALEIIKGELDRGSLRDINNNLLRTELILIN
jgi:hypothetical protein